MIDLSFDKSNWSLLTPSIDFSSRIRSKSQHCLNKEVI